MSEHEARKGPPQTTVRARERRPTHSLEGLDASFAERDRKAFGELIDLAERVQAERDNLRRQIYFSIGGVSFLAIAAVSALVTIFELSSLDRFLNTAGGLLAVITIGASYAAGAAIYFHSASRLRRESKAFREVMDIVHELHESLKEELSPLELAELRIRLSRLDN